MHPVGGWWRGAPVACTPAAAGQDCCAFFDFTPHLTPEALKLSVCAPESAADAGLFGAPA
ncbi:hypothetical protein OG784_01240 [Streptomyces sp. NBC_01617]|uniref:hypothetical protein n=1 Tax=Streptomyces sp. NBC_01617 TaxID=2975899 RepID=UPI00386D25EC|nr:hypothetical protein OG784_01240 [Streptomyces sp. NBC_01617]